MCSLTASSVAETGVPAAIAVVYAAQRKGTAPSQHSMLNTLTAPGFANSTTVSADVPGFSGWQTSLEWRHARRAKGERRRQHQGL